MKEFSFNTAYTQARELYGLTLDPDVFETMGLIAGDKIGNRRNRLYKYVATPLEREIESSDSETTTTEYYIELPCNADIVEMVTANYEDYQKTSPMKNSGEGQNGWVEEYIESRKFNTPFNYNSGKFVKYYQEGSRIYLADQFETVIIFYKGILSDNTGLPFLNVQEIDAIAAFCAYSSTFKDALVTKDANLMQFAQLLEVKWKKLVTQARVPDYINQNEIDEILNVSTSGDRKRFGKSFKGIK